MAHRVTTETRSGRTIHTLHDDATGASASIHSSYGFNLFDLRLPVAGQVRPIVVAAPDFADNPRGGGGHGTPVLFPFPNRIAGARFDWRERTYELPVNNGPNSIHGFAIAAPWEVVDQSTGSGAASITGRYQISVNSPEMREKWPTDAVLQVRYSLAGRRLTMDVTITNPTADDLPYGFGIHPYFRCPFAPDGDQEQTRVTLPASEFWVLDAFIPTGDRRPVDDRLDFRRGKPMKGLKLDDVLTGLEFEADRCICRLRDLALNAEFRLIADRQTRELVVYTPPGPGGVLAIEPYTQATDAVHLAARGVDGGLRVLGHGKSESLQIVMETDG